MPEKESIYSSKVTYSGIFSFSEFYKFCYTWLTDELGMKIIEKKYAEKLTGDSKGIEVKWEGEKELTDYFRFDTKVSFRASGLKNVEITEGGAKMTTNKGYIEIKIEGILVRDFNGRFETSSFNKFLRGIYEKWVITSRVEEFKGKIASDSDEFLMQTKAYLDLEGKNR